MLDAGTFNFPTVAAFAAGTANAFSVVIGDRAADISQRALGGFVQDSFRAHPTLTFDAGLRYEWNVTPTERDDRFIVFDAPTVSLEPVGVHRATVYEQNNHNIEPRVGIAWDPSRDGSTLIRAAYAFTVEQPMVNAVLNLTANPPLNTPLTVTGTVPVASEFALAATGGLAPITVDPRYDNGVTHGWNVNLQREVARGLAVMISRRRASPARSTCVNGLVAAASILATRPDARIVFVTVQDSRTVIRKAIDSGARGYVVKSDAGHELVAAVRTALEGGVYVSTTARRRLEQTNRDV